MADAPAGPTDADLIAQFLAAKRPGTARIYRQPLAAWLAHCPQGLRAATAADARRFAATVLAGKAPMTRERWIYVLRSFYRWAQTAAGFAANPWIAVAPPDRVVRRPQPRLAPEHIRRLLATATGDDRAAALILLCVTTGIGLTEAARARWGDLAHSDDGHLVLRVRGARARLLKLVPEAWEALRRYRARLGLPTALDATSVDPLFWGQRGGPVTPEALTKIIADTAAQAGLTTPTGRRITAQTLRQAHARLAYAGGATPPQIQAALGLRHRQRVDVLLATAPPIGETSADAVERVIFSPSAPSRSNPPEG